MICITLHTSRFSERIRQCFTEHINWFSRKISGRNGGGNKIIVLVFQIKVQVFFHILRAFVLQDRNRLSLLLNGSTTIRKSSKIKHYHPVQTRYIYLVSLDQQGTYEGKIPIILHICTTGLHTPAVLGQTSREKGKALSSSQVFYKVKRHK